MIQYCEALKGSLKTAKSWYASYVKKIDNKEYKKTLNGPRHLKESIIGMIDEMQGIMFSSRAYWHEQKFLSQFSKEVVRLQMSSRYEINHKSKRFVYTPDKEIKLGNDVIFLPDNFYVNGDLVLTKTSLKKLPKCLVVNGRLDIGDLRVAIPDDIQVNGDFYAVMEKAEDPRRKKVKELAARGQITGKLSILY